ncbi:MAG: UDP-glucose 4-epimerase GalE [Acidobacteria bacterium]|nr:UDP-glucose 4-epimerase GalE [Acidobacteriota bacterium]MBI3426510.1 UDP-glucose 4-epimerase GalE [Acidobacteriota bacterium]
MNVLVTGGAGYIGSVVVEQLLQHGQRAVIYDDPGTGPGASFNPDAPFVSGALTDQTTLAAAFEQHQIEAVIHLTAVQQPSAAFNDPHASYQNNLINGLALLETMRQTGVKKLVFASSAAVYGEPASIPIKEDAPLQPLNPYGESVLAFERALRWYEEAHELRYACLRCFNVAGATATSRPDTPTHLIPTVLHAAAGQVTNVDVFGENYPTPDGTCVRDYVHVLDVAEAIVLVVPALEKASCVYNVGHGNGYSVAEVVEMARQITGTWISTEAAPRRPGEPAVLIASPDKLMLELGWQPRQSELDVILESAWRRVVGSQ